MKRFLIIFLCLTSILIANDSYVPGLADPYLDSIFHDMGVTFFFTETGTPTSQIACLVTREGEHSFCAFVKTEKDLKPKHFDGIKLAHLSGYCLPNGIYIEKGLSLAKEAGAIVSLDLANACLVNQFRERLVSVISVYVDILFANEDEAYALTHLPPKKAAAFLKNFCTLAIVKVGEKGCWVCSSGGLFHSPGIPTHVVDKAGVGDLFDSAFLYGYLKAEPLERCAYLGNLACSATIEQYGAELSPQRWAEILHTFEISDCIQTDPSL